MTETEDRRMEWIGKPVVYVDPTRVKHNALITAVHSMRDNGEPWSINCVFVVQDLAKADSYGRQIERATSCSHFSLSGAPGYNFRMPGE